MSAHATSVENASAASPEHAGHADHRSSYFKVFWILLALTIVEVGLSYVPLPHKITATLMVGLALTKAAYVGLFYMHLKYEARSLMWLAFIPLPLAAFYAVFLGLDAHNLIRAITSPFLGHGH